MDRTLLFLDKVLMDAGDGCARGVELFNLNLIRDLTRLQWAVTAPVHPDWLERVRACAEPGRIEAFPSVGFGPIAAGRLLRALRGRTFAALLLGNVANRLTMISTLLRMARIAPQCALIAHREPTRRCLFAQKAWPTTVVAVNRQIAGHFERFGFSRVHVHYGVTDADRFFPAPAPRADDAVHFCVLGQLDNAWKGADTAVAAFELLPEDVRRRCRLHLASFRTPPDFGDTRIRAYAWMDVNGIPDFLRGMDAMIVPSRDEKVMRETFSQAMVQGMLSGLPLLANRLPILEEKLDEGGGLVFDGPAGLRDAIVRLANDSDERARMGARARAVALQRYVWDTRVFADRFLPGCSAAR